MINNGSKVSLRLKVMSELKRMSLGVINSFTSLSQQDMVPVLGTFGLVKPPDLTETMFLLVPSEFLFSLAKTMRGNQKAVETSACLRHRG
jgi:hypothetical protein